MRLTTDLEKLDFEINGASVHVLTVDQILAENREQTQKQAQERVLTWMKT